MHRWLSIIFLSLFLVSSCAKKQDNVVVFREFQNTEWSRFDYLNGELEVIEAPCKYDIVMEVMVSDDYPSAYENHKQDCPLLFNLTIKNPNDSGSRSKDYKFALKDKDGNWKADKTGEYYIFRLPIINEMTFSEKGIYNFKIENKYTKDPLYGIKSLSLKVNSVTK